MTGFCVEQISTEQSLCADHGVLRDAAMSVTNEARQAAERILAGAQNEAKSHLERARTDAQHVIDDAEQKVFSNADELLRSLQQTQDTFLNKAEDIIIDLALALFERLVMEMTPRERLEASLKRVIAEAPLRLVNALLRLHPDDMELVPEIEWECKADRTLSRGSCRLEASNGEWCVDFNAATAALKSALKTEVKDSSADVAES